MDLIAEKRQKTHPKNGKCAFEDFGLVAVVDSQTYWFDDQGIDATSVSKRFDDDAFKKVDFPTLFCP